MLRILLLNGLILLKYRKEVQKILGWISSVMIPTQPAFTCSKLTKEALEQGVKYIQS